jgi:N6-adenosine-specific RNA methylase IME4
MKKYNIIYADPAWKMGYVIGGKYAGTVKGGEKLPYQTMSDDEIMALPIKNIVADNAFLFMWVTDCKLEVSFQVMRAWGFEFNSIGFYWNKTCKGKNTVNEVRTTLTPYTRRSGEYCLLGLRGKTKHMVINHKVLQYLPYASETRQHSVKPPETRDRIVQMLGDLPRLELFARQEVNGWDCWGNEVKNSIIL